MTSMETDRARHDKDSAPMSSPPAPLRTVGIAVRGSLLRACLGLALGPVVVETRGRVGEVDVVVLREDLTSTRSHSCAAVARRRLGRHT